MPSPSPETSPLYLAIQAIFRVANSLDHLPDVVGAERQVAQSAGELCWRAQMSLRPKATRPGNDENAL